MKRILSVIFIAIIICSCKLKEERNLALNNTYDDKLSEAEGFALGANENGKRIIEVLSPWPNSEKTYNYLLVPKGEMVDDEEQINIDAVIEVPVERLVVTSTTHIAALEALGVENSLVGFPGTAYVSSENTRKRIDNGEVAELGANELINVEILLSLDPDMVVGFSIDNQNSAYETIEEAGIPVVYNGDWTEATPLGKAEWIKFFGPFFGLEKKADSIYSRIKADYEEARDMAAASSEKPTVLSGALYKDVWYLPAGESWAAAFIKDANAQYLWADTAGNGSLSLSLESVLEKGLKADIWISPSQFTSYEGMLEDNPQYDKFEAFRDKKIYTFAATKGSTGGLLYYELGPQRPDLVLKDLIAIFHPGLLQDYQPYFFKPLE